MRNQSITEFRAGLILRRSFTVMGQNVLTFWLIALILYLPGTVFDIYIQNDLSDSLFSIQTFTAIFIGVLFDSLTVAALLPGVFRILRNEKADARALIAEGNFAVIAVLGPALVLSLILSIGYMAWVLPAVIMSALFFIVIPIYAVEQVTIRGLFKRNFELTEGVRGRIFGLFLLLVLASVALLIVIELLHFGERAEGGHTVGYYISRAILFSLFSAYSSVVVIVTYHDLRVLKEGGDANMVAKVFD